MTPARPTGWRRRLVPQSAFAKNVALLAGGTAVAQGLTVVATPALSRLYTPEDYGLFAAFSAVLALLAVGSTCSFEQAVPLPKDDATAKRLLALALAAAAGSSALLALLLAIWSPMLASSWHLEALAAYWWLLPLGTLAAGVYRALSYWAMREKSFGALAETRLRQSLGQVGTQLGMGLMAAGPLGLLLGGLVGQAAGIGRLARLSLGPAPSSSPSSPPAFAAVAGRYRKFALLATPASLLNATNLQLPALALAACFGPVAVGLFALGQRVVSAPMELVGEAVRKVFYQEAASLAAGDPRGLRRLFGRTAARLLFIGAGPMALLALAGPALCAWVFGEAWRQTGVYMQLLAPMFLLKFVAVPTDTLAVLERQEWTLGRELARLALWGLAISWIAWTRPEPVQAVALLGLAGSAAYALYFALSWWALTQHFACPAQGAAWSVK